MPIDAERFRDTMGQLVSGVAVLVVRNADGEAMGMTASSVTSLSLDPPMILVCVDHAADIHNVLVGAPVFGVSVLAVGQAHLAKRFATRGQQRFDGLEVALSPGGFPKLRGAIAHLECRRNAVYPGGDHSIVTGVVEWAESPGGAPLCYFRSAYAELAP